jgi:hypothetical protein
LTVQAFGEQLFGGALQVRAVKGNVDRHEFCLANVLLEILELKTVDADSGTEAR